MRLLLEPTAEPAIIDGVLCRLWTGHDEDGIPVHAWIMHISPQTHDPQALREFDQRLHEIPAPEPIGMIYQSGALFQHFTTPDTLETPATGTGARAVRVFAGGEELTGAPPLDDAWSDDSPVTAPEPYDPVDPDYDDPDARGIT